MTTTSIDPFASAGDMLEAMRTRQVSSLELLDLHLRRIERYNPLLNAIVYLDVEQARERAAQADRYRERGRAAGMLLGLPMTIKDCIYVAGMPTTGGVPERAGTVEVEDAPIAGSVQRAGAVVMGKTNVPPYASDWQSDNPVYGRSLNPWDRERTPGGSTGGGAAAVAAGLTPLELGGDFAGSIRVPAAFCGIYGHKPSLTAVPQTGHFPGDLLPNRATGLAVLGPLARSAEDLELTLDVTAGPDLGEEVAWQVRIPRARRERLRDFRVAVMPAIPWLPVEPSIGEALDRIAEDLGRLGARVAVTQPDMLGDVRDYYALYTRFMAAIESTRLEGERRVRMAERLRTSGDEFLAAYADGLAGTASDFVVWHARREAYRASYRQFFRDWDVLLAPATFVNAFAHDGRRFGERRLEVGGRSIYYGRLSVYPGLANLTGHPGTAFPGGSTPDGLPVGLQAIGPYLEDRTPIRFAALLGQERGGFVPPPGFCDTT